MSTRNAMELTCDCTRPECATVGTTCGTAIVEYAKSNRDIWFIGSRQGWSHEMVGRSGGTRRDYCPACTAHRNPDGGADA